ncbi:MAG: sensor domain-containing diguanylate cyclase [Oleibacter sp.]|nr:sensor domain-containing diguanylate cyclase [Thalassolituus sp.]
MPEFQSLNDFDDASRAVLLYLKEKTGMGLWMTTRVIGDEQIVLNYIDDVYGVEKGTSLSWCGSLCKSMVEGNGPSIAPDIKEIQVYRESPNGQTFDIGAYLGVPIFLKDGTLFGTLCGYDPQIQKQDIESELSLVTLLANMLGALASRQIQVISLKRENGLLIKSSQQDELTNLLNRRGWNKCLNKETQRSEQLGISMGIFILDLDDLKVINDTSGHGAGDDLLIETANVLRANLHEHDVIARLGGDEFGVLVLNTNMMDAQLLLANLKTLFENANINVSIGMHLHRLGQSINESIKKADESMYESKTHRKTVHSQRP